MLNGLYVATSGMLQETNRMNVISNNLANLMTTGYKKERTTFRNYLPKTQNEYPQNIIKDSLYNKTINSSVKLDDIKTDFSLGNYKQTGQKLDFAIGNKKVFFAVDTPFGVRFTRDGKFKLDENGEVVTQDGFKVLSDNLQSLSGIQLNPKDEFVITEKGDIIVNGNKTNTIFMAEFENLSNLQKVGRNLYAAIGVEPDASENPELKQGFVEISNVNAVEEMVRMIESSRGYETYQKVIQTMDELNSKASNEIGRLG